MRDNSYKNNPGEINFKLILDKWREFVLNSSSQTFFHEVISC